MSIPRVDLVLGVHAEDEVMQICREPRHQGDPRARIQAGSRLLRWALVETIQQ